jgi:putative two-component system response regulator
MAEETILVVEDNDITRQGLQLMLEAGGYKVMAAMHGLEALEQMETRYPDLVISDISMPEMDGYKLFERVRSRPDWIAIPFIFLSARGSREDVILGKELGVEDYLVKPVERKELLLTVQSRLSRSQELLLAELQQAYQASLILFSNAIELRDQYTRGHVERVMEYSKCIAQKLGWTPQQIYLLQFGSILHDIGKIYISEQIIKKTGPLNDEEWEEMKRHPQMGAELIKNIPYLAPAIPVILYHHERWDGQGYPTGLSGEEIPLEARIVTIADSLDAITTERVYRESSTDRHAYEEIVNCSGTRYDPTVIEAFKKAWVEIRVNLEEI